MILDNYFTKEEIEQIKKEPDLVLKCQTLVTRLFKDKKDKEGKPYIGHLLRVSNRCETTEEKSAALLHDTLEDIEGMTPGILLYLNIPKNIIDIVLLVTKTKEIPYEEEINKIISSGNIEAIRVKYSDMLDNSDPERLARLEEETRTRLSKKYQPQLKKLEKVLKRKEEIK